MRLRTVLVGLLLVTCAVTAAAQSAITTRSTNLRRGPSTHSRRIRLLSAGEQVIIISTSKRNGYDRVETELPDTGWVWAKNIQIQATVTPLVTPPVTPPIADSVTPNIVIANPPVPGTVDLAGCGDGLWQHVYNPYRLLVYNECVTITGVIVDATNGRTSDGVRHEADGDTHGWLRPDPPFANMLNNGNMTAEGGNLVFEIVCHFRVTQADARPACSTFGDHTIIPPVGSHVQISGTFVQDTNHQRWNEIHPVSHIVVIP